MGNRIAEYREKKGLSQAELARRLGFDRSYMNRLERGKQNVSVATATRIAAILECKVEDIFFTNDVD